MRQHDVDRAVIDEQRRRLADKDEQIAALEVELEATRALADAEPSIREQFLRERARWYRTVSEYYQTQAELGFRLVRALQEQRR